MNGQAGYMHWRPDGRMVTACGIDIDQVDGVAWTSNRDIMSTLSMPYFSAMTACVECANTVRVVS